MACYNIMESFKNETASVIIIGAGISGASAANVLVAKGFNVTIIEARNRIGGRIHTDRTTLSKPVDLGARSSTVQISL